MPRISTSSPELEDFDTAVSRAIHFAASIDDGDTARRAYLQTVARRLGPQYGQPVDMLDAWLWEEFRIRQR